jgi:hypothetical protein
MRAWTRFNPVEQRQAGGGSRATRSLKAAKAECDKELQQVTNNIAAFFEERLRDAGGEREAE